MMEEFVLESSLRRLVQDPMRVLRELDARRGMVIMDIGCGYGFLSVPAARLVGPSGLVYSIDVDDFKLQRLKKRAEAEGLVNLRPIKSEAWRIEGVDPATVDLAVMFFSLHHFERVRESLEEANSKLRRGGRLYVYDPIRSRFAGHGTDAEEVLEEGVRRGFRLGSLKKSLLTYRLELVKP